MTMEKGLAFLVKKYQLDQQDEGGRGLGRSGENYYTELFSSEDKTISSDSGINIEFQINERKQLEGGDELPHGLLLQKQFSCKICGMKFSQKENLRDHERCHPYGCLFICQICELKFHRKDRLQNHRRLVHNLNDEIILDPRNPEKQTKEISMSSLIRAVEKVKLQRYLKRQSGKHNDQTGIQNSSSKGRISNSTGRNTDRLSLAVSLMDKPDQSKDIPVTFSSFDNSLFVNQKTLLKSIDVEDEPHFIQDSMDEPLPKKAKLET